MSDGRVEVATGPGHQPGAGVACEGEQGRGVGSGVGCIEMRHPHDDHFVRLRNDLKGITSPGEPTSASCHG